MTKGHTACCEVVGVRSEELADISYRVPMHNSRRLPSVFERVRGSYCLGHLLSGEDVVMTEVHRHTAKELVDVLMRVPYWQETDLDLAENTKLHQHGQVTIQELALVLFGRVVELQFEHWG